MTDTVGAFEAKPHLSALLDRVEKGETIPITRHGAPVARLVPVKRIPAEAERAEAIAKIKELGRRYTLGGLSLKELIEDGRE